MSIFFRFSPVLRSQTPPPPPWPETGDIDVYPLYLRFYKGGLGVVTDTGMPLSEPVGAQIQDFRC